MLRPIIRLLNARLDALTWIERRGGLVQTATKVFTDANGARVDHRFPITDDAFGRSCFEDGRYYEMLPSSKLKAVTFWQQLGDMALIDQGPKKNRNVFRGRVRLVGWLNVPALGVEDSQVPASAHAAVLNAMTVGQQQQSITEGPLQGVTYEVKTVALINRLPLIFQAYTLPDSALMYPVDYFAIDFDLTISVPVSCLGFVPGAEVCEEHKPVVHIYEGVITVGQNFGQTGYKKSENLGSIDPASLDFQTCAVVFGEFEGAHTGVPDNAMQYYEIDGTVYDDAALLQAYLSENATVEVKVIQPYP